MGPERDAYDRIWPDPVRAQFATSALNRPQANRQLLVDAVRKRLSAAGETVTPGTLERVLDEEAVKLSGPNVLH